jgi:hypothetical protein
VNFAVSDPVDNVLDEVDTCAGTVAAPTAPSGQVCIYLNGSGGIDSAPANGLSGEALLLPTRSFQVSWVESGVANEDEYVYATWAYTAP